MRFGVFLDWRLLAARSLARLFENNVRMRAVGCRLSAVGCRLSAVGPSGRLVLFFFFFFFFFLLSLITLETPVWAR